MTAGDAGDGIGGTTSSASGMPADGGAAGSGNPAWEDCDEVTAVELEFSVQVVVANDGCAKITQYPTWWGVRNMRLDSPPGTGSFPIPFEWRSECQDSRGSGVLEQAWGSTTFGLTDATCATLIDLRGVGDGTVGLMYFDTSG